MLSYNSLGIILTFTLQEKKTKKKQEATASAVDSTSLSQCMLWLSQFLSAFSLSLSVLNGHIENLIKQVHVGHTECFY